MSDMKFRKKPVVVEAQQLEDDYLSFICVTNWVIMGGGKVYQREDEPCLYIETLEGRMRVDIGDWVIRGVKGEFYPCKPDIFDATYESASSVSGEPSQAVVSEAVAHAVNVGTQLAEIEMRVAADKAVLEAAEALADIERDRSAATEDSSIWLESQKKRAVDLIWAVDSRRLLMSQSSGSLGQSTSQPVPTISQPLEQPTQDPADEWMPDPLSRLVDELWRDFSGTTTEFLSAMETAYNLGKVSGNMTWQQRAVLEAATSLCNHVKEYAPALLGTGLHPVRHLSAAVDALTAAESTADGHPEDHCHRCGGPNITWAAPSPLWNEVMRGGDIEGRDLHDGIVCPTCFAILAEKIGLANYWQFNAPCTTRELTLVTPSGRVWDAERWLWVEPSTADGPEQTDGAAQLESNDQGCLCATECQGQNCKCACHHQATTQGECWDCGSPMWQDRHFGRWHHTRGRKDHAARTDPYATQASSVSAQAEAGQ